MPRHLHLKPRTPHTPYRANFSRKFSDEEPILYCAIMDCGNVGGSISSLLDQSVRQFIDIS
ncbi:hypothetical protein BJ165DRAFT_1510286 [Panaeolus papilionaceus]|nr:hypothetical protein BJ165DRAFT_1510286 [Panaeolus papilionaceus]